MNIYKEDLIEALETEPLGWGSWAVHYNNLDLSKNILLRDVKKCKVCAVGSVFRRFSDITFKRTPDTIDSLIEGNASPNNSFNRDPNRPRNWITAISYVWESISENNDDIAIPEARTIMIDWVEKNVPEDETLWEVNDELLQG